MMKENMKKMMNKSFSNYHRWGLFIILLMGVLFSAPLLLSGIPRGHDLIFHLSRISALTYSMECGTFPPKIYPNYLYGYGYANGIFYPDIFIYITSFMTYLGLNVVIAYKILIIAITFATALIMYYTVKSMTDSVYMSTAASVLYTFSSYRAVDIFQRAALGEIIAFTFLPLIVLGVYEILYRDNKKWWILSIGMSGVILSHVLTAFMVTPFIAIICLINVKKIFKCRKILISTIFAAVSTILLSLHFILPMIEQTFHQLFKYNTVINTPEYRSFKSINCIFEGDIFPHEYWEPAGIGTIFLILGLICIGTSFNKLDNKIYLKNFSILSIFLGIVALVGTTNLFPWKLLLPQLKVIQFPWRLLIIATLFLSIGFSIMIGLSLKKFQSKVIILIIIILGCLYSHGSVIYTKYKNGSVVHGHTIYDIMAGEYLPQKMSLDFIKANGNSVNHTGDLELILNRRKEGTSLDVYFFNNFNMKNRLELPLTYYYGYRAICFTEGKQEDLNIVESDNGLMQMDICNVEKGLIKVWYAGTEIQKWSSVISAAYAIFIIGFIVNDKTMKFKNCSV